MKEGIMRKLLATIVAIALCAIALVGCSSEGGDVSSSLSAASEDATASGISTEGGDQDTTDTTETVTDGKASSDNMPVPDFSKLMKMSRQEAVEYLAAYPHYESDNSDPIDAVNWTEYYSSPEAKEAGIGWDYEAEKPVCDPGSWVVSLSYDNDDDIETCDAIVFYMTPLSDTSEQVSTKTYAAMIENYLAGSDIHEMTIAVRDLSGREGNYSNNYDGYVLFDDLAASVGAYYLDIRPNPNANGYWEEIKSRIADGYYLDVHSGGVTYTYPYIDVYSTASDL